MKYFLKKTKNKKGTYLQIYKGYYNPEKRNSEHRSFKTIGYVHNLIKAGIVNPEEFYKAEVDKLNNELINDSQANTIPEVTDVSPEKNLGYFLLDAYHRLLSVESDLKLISRQYKITFNLYNFISDLVYSRVLDPKSKLKTLHNVMPKLYNFQPISLDQMYQGISEIGNDYEKIIDIYNFHIDKLFQRDVSKTFFDCTNFYFEIDQQDEFRRKGPSKENKPNPLVGLGLLLDSNLFPLGMKLYPGNKNEKPIIREIIKDLKEHHSITGRTIHIADKGLNCSENIAKTIQNGDGYLFSKSIKSLKETELSSLLDLETYEKVLDHHQKIKYYFKEYLSEKVYSYINENGEKINTKVIEKSIITYNPSLANKNKIEINNLMVKALNLCNSQAKKYKYGESGKYVDFITSDENPTTKVIPIINEQAIERDKQLAGFNILVTSETNLPPCVIYDTYHQLWRIEESFRFMKSYLDARPVYLQKEETIKGHFLICYLSLLLFRFIQFNLLNNEFTTDEIIEFIRNFNIVKVSENNFISLFKKTNIQAKIKELTKLPVLNSYFKDLDIKRILHYKIAFSTRK